MLNFGFLGYKATENKFSYPRPTEDKVMLVRCIETLGRCGDQVHFCKASRMVSVTNEAVMFAAVSSQLVNSIEEISECIFYEGEV